MNQIGAKIRGFFNTRLGFLVLAIVLFWAKTYWAYQAKFNLGVTGSFQHLIHDADYRCPDVGLAFC